MRACDHSAVQDPSRRAVLATGGVLSLSACLPGAEDEPPRPDPDLRLRRRAATQVRGLAAAYAAVVSAYPEAGTSLQGSLRGFAAEHEAHVTALAGPEPSSSAAAPSPPPAAPAVPATLPAALGWLAGLERTAARLRTRQSLRAGADLARLLAAVGACETTHAALLDGEASG